MAKLLLDRGAEVNVRNDLGQTPLHKAASRGHLQAAKLLLDRGVDRAVRDQAGLLARDFALAKSHHDVAKVLAPLVSSQDLGPAQQT